MWVYLSAVAAVLAQSDQDLSPFEFRGLTSKTSEEAAVQAAVVYGCHKQFGNLRECLLSVRSIGGASMILGTADFVDDRMVSVEAVVAPENFDQVRTALQERYGSPCLTDPSPSRALKVGRSYYWCFSDGAARIEQLGFSGMSKFAFYSRTYDDIIGDIQPKVDF